MKTDRPKITICVTHMIVDTDTFNLSVECLKRIRNNTWNQFQLICVDNESNPSTISYLAYNSDIYIRNDRNRGNGMAWDQGIALAENDIIVLMDNDVFVEKDWDVEMIEKLSDPQVGITFAYSKRGDLIEDYAGRRDGFLLAFRKETYEKAGKFLCDQPFVLGYYEDDWFEYRVQKKLGLKLVACPSSKVWHKGQGTTKKIMSQEILNGIEANKKWYFGLTNGELPHLDKP